MKIGTALALNGLLWAPAQALPCPGAGTSGGGAASRPELEFPDCPVGRSLQQHEDLLCQRPGPSGHRQGRPSKPAGLWRYQDPRPSASSTKSMASSRPLGFSMGDVVKIQVFLVNDAHVPMDFKGSMEVYTQFFGGNQPSLPARAVIGVSALANPGFPVEIEAPPRSMGNENLRQRPLKDQLAGRGEAVADLAWI